MELPLRLVNGTGYQTANLGVRSSNLFGRARITNNIKIKGAARKPRPRVNTGARSGKQRRASTPRRPPLNGT
jgi:hypothetical protein